MGDEAVVVEAYVNANGRVEDYRILSQPDDAQAVLPQLKNLLIFTTFQPALSMGRPTAWTALLSFSKISVRGLASGCPPVDLLRPPSPFLQFPPTLLFHPPLPQ